MWRLHAFVGKGMYMLTGGECSMSFVANRRVVFTKASFCSEWSKGDFLHLFNLQMNTKPSFVSNDEVCNELGCKVFIG